MDKKPTIDSIFAIDFCFDRFCGDYCRTMLKQLDVLLESRETEYDEFSLGIFQGFCMALGLRRRMNDAVEPYYSWDDVRAVRERGCLHEIRGEFERLT